MKEKQAVLIIHGIGEQKPMGTLRDFVKVVWNDDKSLRDNPAEECSWSKPDTLSGNYELKRITTNRDKNGVRTDFFEFYWAHMLEGTTLSQVGAWVKTLILRAPWKIPRLLLLTYIVIWLLIFGVSAGVFLDYKYDWFKVPAWLTLLSTVVLIPFFKWLVKNVVGDAARYLLVAPGNVKSRTEIRKAGIELLKALHDPERGYGRVILVGHSLGSVIGYDMLTHYWSEVEKVGKVPNTSMTALTTLESFPESGLDVYQYQIAQRTYLSELQSNGCKWLVSDFVTMGSPLSHAAILLAGDLDELRLKQKEREFPTCPATRETYKNNIRRFSFPAIRSVESGHWIPNHAAVFAPTRWTNLYFPSSFILRGDLIGGPLKGAMGEGVRDIKVKRKFGYNFFTHTKYWTPTGIAKESHIDKLREALNLLDT